ncbi:hypothetical protein ILUMI_12812 [Ignelater luminosus]|uniref:Uncharacterized protein n=1 Tax=Ignelater luminosus TaxID=2038154 RepID=A0A8K0CXF5_IGNLU|nr:hypothetical protein ILUMI_12812 [Ignelater luminosus]
MIIETKPLHKKKKRLAKQRSIRETQGPLSMDLDADSPMELHGAIIPEFKVYNRYQELARRERELKELAWERELQLAMEASDPLSTGSKEDTSAPTQTCSSCPKARNIDMKINNTSPQIKKLRSCGPTTKEGCCSAKGGKCLNLLEDSTSSQLPSISNQNKVGSGKEKVRTSSDTICDIQNKLQSLDFIDRSPSPVERLKST